MASANRIYYAVQAVQMQGVNGPGIDAANPEAVGTWKGVFGVQSVGISTNFNLENVFQLGEFDQYDVLDDNPEIEVTLNKVIDYTDPIYKLACGGSSYSTTGKNILELASRRCNVRLLVGSDIDNQNATGTLKYAVKMTGMYLSSITYTFATDGNFTEEATLVGNNKVWYTGAGVTDSPNLTASTASEQVHPSDAQTEGFNNLRATGIARRWNINLGDSVLPSGLTSWDGGIIMPHDGAKNVVPHITSLTVSCDLGREPLFELGSRNPYTRFVNVPLEVTSEFEVIATDFDVSASNFGSASACAANTRNLQAREIYLRLCGPSASDSNGAKGMNFYLGKNNRLTSVNYSGGDTGGGNVTVTYSFTGYNNFYVDQGAKITVTAAPYSGRGFNTCGRTASGLEGTTPTFSTGGTGTAGGGPGSTV
jgi:hypothetical protein